MTGKRTFFVGDAAGLIDASMGGGIHYALFSARRMAYSLRDDRSYEEAMQSCVEDVAQIFDRSRAFYFMKRLTILKKGKPLLPEM
jgi:flavin-dependent dehydrogenase